MPSRDKFVWDSLLDFKTETIEEGALSIDSEDLIFENFLNNTDIYHNQHKNAIFIYIAQKLLDGTISLDELKILDYLLKNSSVAEYSYNSNIFSQLLNALEIGIQAGTTIQCNRMFAILANFLNPAHGDVCKHALQDISFGLFEKFAKLISDIQKSNNPIPVQDIYYYPEAICFFLEQKKECYPQAWRLFNDYSDFFFSEPVIIYTCRCIFAISKDWKCIDIDIYDRIGIDKILKDYVEKQRENVLSNPLIFFYIFNIFIYYENYEEEFRNGFHEETCHYFMSYLLYFYALMNQKEAGNEIDEVFSSLIYGLSIFMDFLAKKGELYNEIDIEPILECVLVLYEDAVFALKIEIIDFYLHLLNAIDSCPDLFGIQNSNDKVFTIFIESGIFPKIMDLYEQFPISILEPSLQFIKWIILILDNYPPDFIEDMINYFHENNLVEFLDYCASFETLYYMSTEVFNLVFLEKNEETQ